jgi:hypothetical protein
MAQVNLNSIIADYASTLITLRDDQARLKALLDGDSLTTVMGPAANAGVKEATVIVAGLRANAVFHAMTKDSPNQEQLFAWLAKAIQDVMLDTGKATVAKVIADVNTEYVERIKSLNNRTETTMGKLEAASKLLLSGAEAKANIITRKREEAQARFVASLELVKTKVALINTLDGRLEIMSVDLEKVSADPKVELEDMYRRVGQISNGQKAMTNQKEIAVQSMVNHFGDQTALSKSAKTDLVSLKIPEDMEQGKGKELMTNFEMYIIGRSEQYYALMPYLQRVLEDYDHTTGACFKPPCMREAILDIHEDIRDAYTSQSKNLYGAIMSKLSDSVSCLVKASFQYGTDDKSALCAEHDGPNLLFALICMFRPCNVEYTEQLESLFIDAHNKFRGNDARETIKALREPLIEAQTLQMAFKWSQSGKRIVDLLVHNDHNMGDALAAFKKLDVADKDCTAQLDKLFAAVEAQCNRTDKQNGKVTAFSMRLHSHGEPEATRPDTRDQTKCHFGDRCRRFPTGECPFKHDEKEGNTSERLGKGGRQNDHANKRGKGGKLNKCKGAGCPDNASKGKAVCTTCFFKACEGDIKLKDGSVFQGSRKHDTTVGILTKGKIQDLKKAFAAIVGDEESSDDEDAPVGVGGPACSAGDKRKRAALAATEQSIKRVKDFAEELGIKFN